MDQEYFVVLTMATQFQAGVFSYSTFADVARVRPGGTVAEIYRWAVSRLPREMHGGSVLCFSVTPNKAAA
jgi:hypothetical protein